MLVSFFYSPPTSNALLLRAGLSRTLIINGIMTAGVYWMSKSYEDQAKLHSAMIDHYIELHPEDFKVFDKGTPHCACLECN